MSFNSELLKLINTNKAFPYYQAERRIDIFINLYLEEILNYSLDTNSIIYISPELALKKQENNLSTKVDYLCFDTAEKRIFFVELKTDKKSFKTDQLENYLSYKTWGTCMDEIAIISKVSKYKAKFTTLINRLTDTNLWNEEARNYPVSVVYLTPENPQMSQKIISLNAANRTREITFNSLENFHSERFPEEWPLFYSAVLKPIEQN